MTLQEIEYYHPYNNIMSDIEIQVNHFLDVDVNAIFEGEGGTFYFDVEKEGDECYINLEIQVDYEYEAASFYGSFSDATPEYSNVDWVITEIKELQIYRDDLETLSPPDEYVNKLIKLING